MVIEEPVNNSSKIILGLFIAIFIGFGIYFEPKITGFGIYEMMESTPPIVQLISPSNNTTASSLSQTFTCNITDETQVTNLELYVWDSSGNYITGDNIQIWNKTLTGDSPTLGSGYFTSPQDVATDSDGNVYFIGTVRYQSGPTTWYPFDIWIEKDDSSGNQLWNKTIGETSYDEYARRIITDDLGNIYAIGYTNSSGNIDFWTIKYNSNGVQIWNKTAGGSDNDYGYAISKDNSGNILVTGATNSFGAGDSDVWTIKYYPNGTQIWNNTIGGTGSDIGSGIATDSSGNIYIVGTTSSFETGGLWIVKYYSNGTQISNTTMGELSDNGVDISFDYAGNYYVAGITNQSGAGMDDYWTIKFNSNGNQLWNRTFGSPYSDTALAGATDSAGNFYITGQAPTYGWTVKYDSNGNNIWNKTVGYLSETGSWGSGIASDKLGNIYVASHLPAVVDKSGLLKYEGYSSSLSGTSNLSSWNINLSSYGNYTWNCLGYDNSSNLAWSSEGNYSLFIVDSIAPGISNVKNYSNDWQTFIFSAQSNETGSCSLFGNWSGSWAINETKAVTANTRFNFTSITFPPNGFAYSWGINCSDISGNVVWSINSSTSQVYVPNKTITTCITMSIPNTVYYLNADIMNQASTCMRITASNITLDCRGYRIDSNLAGNYDGIDVYTSPTAWISDIKIVNCTISEFSNMGIYAQYVNGLRFESLNVTTTGDHGFFTTVVKNVTIINSQFYLNDGNWIELGDNNSIINSLFANSTRYGLQLKFTNHTNVFDSNFSGNDDNGMYFDGIIDVKVINVIDSHNVDGPWLEGYNNYFERLTIDTSGDGAFMTTLYGNGNNNAFVNCNFINNAYYGLYFSTNPMYNQTITGCTFTNNQYAGLSLVDYMSVTNSTFLDNYYEGVEMYGDYNNITDCTFDGTLIDPESHAIYAEGNYNKIINNTIRNNSIGIYMNGYNNEISFNIIINNTYALEPYYCENCNVYNNYFNSSLDNFYYYLGNGVTHGYYNAWNTSYTLRTNIKNDDYIGGNYWTLTNGSGFSELCADTNGNGICDTTYSINGDPNNTDYLPLTITGTIALNVTNLVNYTNDRLSYTFSAISTKTGSCTLYGTWPTIWTQNETKSVTASTRFNFTSIAFAQNGASYLWGVNCSQADGSNVTSSNITFIVKSADTPAAPSGDTTGGTGGSSGGGGAPADNPVAISITEDTVNIPVTPPETIQIIDETVVETITQEESVMTITNPSSPVTSISISGSNGNSISNLIDIKDIAESSSKFTKFDELFAYKPKLAFTNITLGLGYVCAGPRYAVLKCVDWNYDNGTCNDNTNWSIHSWVEPGLRQISITLTPEDPGLGLGPNPYISYCGDNYCDVGENLDTCSVDCGGGIPRSPIENFIDIFTGQSITGNVVGNRYCQEYWECGKWTQWNSTGYRSRDCVDLNKCNKFKQRPIMIEKCQYMGLESIKTDATLELPSTTFKVPWLLLLIALLSSVIMYGGYLFHERQDSIISQYRHWFNSLFDRTSRAVFPKPTAKKLKKKDEITLLKLSFISIEFITYLILLPFKIIRWIFSKLLEILETFDKYISKQNKK